MPHAYRCRLPAEPSSAAAARRQLETLSWTLEPDESGVLALLVTELIANSVQHADAGEGRAVLDLRHRWQAVMKDGVSREIEELTGRKVIGFMSDNHIDPDRA